MIMHSAGDIEDYALYAHAPSVAVHLCQVGNVNAPWPLWKHKSQFAGLDIGIGAIKAKKLTEFFYLVAFCVFDGSGNLNQEVMLSGLPTIYRRAEQLEAMVYFQYRFRSFTTPIHEAISLIPGAVTCFLSKADNSAKQTPVKVKNDEDNKAS